MLNKIIDFLKELDSNANLRESRIVGEGSSRVVYSLDDNYVVKVPRNIFNDIPTDSWEYSKLLFTTPVGDTHYVNTIGVCQNNLELHAWKSANNSMKQLLTTIVCHGHYKNIPFVVAEKLQTIAEDLPEKSVCRIQQVFSARLDEITDFCELLSLSLDDLIDNVGNYGFSQTQEPKICDYGFAGFDVNAYSFKEVV